MPLWENDTQILRRPCEEHLHRSVFIQAVVGTMGAIHSSSTGLRPCPYRHDPSLNGPVRDGAAAYNFQVVHVLARNGEQIYKSRS